MAANSRYLAFLTSDEGWIFLDRQAGQFLPLLVKTNPNHFSNLFVTLAGQVLVEIAPNSRCSTAATGVDRQADGIREVRYQGVPLMAPVNPLGVG